MWHNKVDKQSHDEDGMLDAALAKYAAAEPRAGLEERILANLRSAETRATERMWPTWQIATALAVVLVVAAALALRWTRMAQPPSANQPSVPTVPVATEAKHHQGNSATTREKAVRRKTRRPLEHEVVAANPKLDVFPSPLPPSEQEKILAIYVGHYPDRAALLAEARMDDLRREAEERRAIAAGERDRKQ